MGRVRRSIIAVLGAPTLLAGVLVAVGLPATAQPSAPVLVISEVMQNPSAVSDSAGEWFEIHNPGSVDVDLDGWTISDDDADSHVVVGSVVVPAGGYAVLGNNADTATNGGVGVDYDYGSSWFLSNGADEIALTDPGGALSDRIAYDGGVIWPDPTGASMTLGDLAADNNDGANWCEASSVFGAGDLGTPGATNDPCAPAPTSDVFIHEIQGPGARSPLVGQPVRISGIVVGDFQAITTGASTDEPLDGFFVQEEDADADADPATSEGIFVFAPGAPAVAVGDQVMVTGTVAEFFGLTEINNVTNIVVVSNSNPLPTPAAPTVPTTVNDPEVQWEAIEGMSVAFGQPLYVSDLFPLGAFGEVGLSAIGPWNHPNQVQPVGSAAAARVRQLNLASRVLLDDGEDENESVPSGLSTWNPTPTPYLGGPDNTLRAGDVIENLFGVVHYAFGEYEIQPVNLVDPTDPDGGVSIIRTPRPAAVPDVGGKVTVASFNVLNYFVTLDNGQAICGPPTFEQRCRGADTQAELDLQSAKIAAAIAELDADIVGLIELENSANDEAIADLVAKVNARSDRAYDYVPTGYIGTDTITVGLIYDHATVAPDGGSAILDSSASPAYIDSKNRPALAQTFIDSDSGVHLTVAVTHLKSKGSACDDVANPGDTSFGVAPYGLGADADVEPLGDPLFTGNCNLTRTAAAKVLGQWIAGDPTGTPSDNLLVLGDLNSYANEDPITELEGQGYTDLVEAFTGTSWTAGGHSYVFDGEFGTLDYAMVSPALLRQVTGAAPWHINADEPFAIDYQNFNPPGQSRPDEWKSSDHDPVIIGLDLVPQCNGLPATIVGTDGDDVLRGTAGDDVIVSLGGDDLVFGRAGNDTICVGGGDDRAFGNQGNDTIFGEAGEDELLGHGGDDVLDGGDDTDTLHGNGGYDTCVNAERSSSCEA